MSPSTQQRMRTRKFRNFSDWKGVETLNVRFGYVTLMLFHVKYDQIIALVIVIFRWDFGFLYSAEVRVLFEKKRAGTLG